MSIPTFVAIASVYSCLLARFNFQRRVSHHVRPVLSSALSLKGCRPSPFWAPRLGMSRRMAISRALSPSGRNTARTGWKQVEGTGQLVLLHRLPAPASRSPSLLGSCLLLPILSTSAGPRLRRLIPAPLWGEQAREASALSERYAETLLHLGLLHLHLGGRIPPRTSEFESRPRRLQRSRLSRRTRGLPRPCCQRRESQCGRSAEVLPLPSYEPNGPKKRFQEGVRCRR